MKTKEPVSLPISRNETQQPELLQRYEIRDILPEASFGNLTRLASFIGQTPIIADDLSRYQSAMVQIHDRSANARNTPPHRLCQYAIREDQPDEVADALNDEQLNINPLFKGMDGASWKNSNESN